MNGEKTPAQLLLLKFLKTRQRPGYLLELSEIQNAMRIKYRSERAYLKLVREAALKELSSHISALINSAPQSVLRATRESTRNAIAHWVNCQSEMQSLPKNYSPARRRTPHEPRYVPRLRSR